MLDQLSQLVQQYGQQSVVENSAVPNEQNQAVMNEAQSSIFGGLQDILANGGLQQVIGMFQGSNAQNANNPVVNQISGNFVDNIMQKFGIDNQTARSIAASLIPAVLGSLFNKAKDPNDSSIQAGDIFGSLTGGQAQQDSGFMGMINKIGGAVGLDKDRDGDVDFTDMAGVIAGFAKGSQQQQAQGGGGIMDMIGGMLGGNKS